MSSVREPVQFGKNWMTLVETYSNMEMVQNFASNLEGSPHL
jgi:hypothetical protein